MKVLITGNLGYIGPVVAQCLKQHLGPATQIVGLDRGFFAGTTLDPQYMADAFVDLQYYGDVRNDEICRKALAGVDAVIHLAAISNDPMGHQFEDITMTINHKRSVAMAKLAKEAGVKSFVFASSCSVYGAGGDEMRTETSALGPLTAYAKSKAMAEEDLSPLATPEFFVTCMRFATACGPSPRLRLDLVLNDFVASAVKSKKIEILSNGQPWRPLIAVSDMARAMTWGVTRRQTSNARPLEILNVGSNQWNYRVVELAEATKSVLRDVEISINENAAPDKRSYRVNFDAYAKLVQPELAPRETLPGIVKQLATQLQNSPWVTPEFRQGPFIRLNILRDLIKAARVDANLMTQGATPWI